MQRAYHSYFSPALGREMELVHFGGSGLPILAFPTAMGRFDQWETSGLAGALGEWLDSGAIQLLCVDSVDSESWFATDRPPAERVARHLQYERYILEEVLPGMPVPPLACGASMGAFHSVLLSLRHPTRFCGFIAMSGLFDNTRWLDGHHDDATYFTNPLAFLPGLTDEAYLEPLRAMRPAIIAAAEDEPAVEDSRKLAALLTEKGVAVELEVSRAPRREWPFWTDVMRGYLSR